MFDYTPNGASLCAERIQVSLGRLQTGIKPRATVTRRGQRVRGVFASLKASGRVTFESRLEYLALTLFETATTVRHVRTHPYVLELPVESTMLRYTPDVELRTQFGPVLCEVKGDGYLSTASQTNRFKQVTSCLQAAGVQHFTLLASDLAAAPGIVNSCRQHLLNRSWPQFGAKNQRTLQHRSNSESAKGPLPTEADLLIQRLLARTPDEVLSSVNARKDGLAC